MLLQSHWDWIKRIESELILALTVHSRKKKCLLLLFDQMKHCDIELN